MVSSGISGRVDIHDYDIEVEGDVEMNMSTAQIKPIIRIVGLISALSYVVVILLTWVLFNMLGYTYFSAGEPNLLIKYAEWTLGGIGIYTVAELLVSEVVKYAERRNVC